MSSLKDLASLIMVPSLVKDGRLDTVKPLGNSIIHPDATGNNDGTDGSTPAEGNFTFSRGSNLAATRVDVNGLIEKGRENLFTQSNNFSHSDWNVKAGTFTQGVADPNGGNNAWSWTATNTDPYLYQSPKTTNGVSVLSIWVKGVGSTIGTSFQIRTGAAPYNNLTLTGEWQRVEHFNTNASGTSVGFEYGNPAVAGDVVHIYQAQYEQGLVATDYIETGASTAQSGILEDLPRLDYSGGASCPSLLLEPQRTNLFTQSEYFSGSYWAKTGTGGGNAPIVTQNYAVSPEGLNNASRVQFDTNGSTSSHRSGLVRDFAFTTGDKYAISCWVKSASGSDEIFTFRIAGAQVGGEKTATNEWQLFTETHIATATTTDNFGMQIRGNYSSQTSDILIYGMQLESAASYPTSYIPTMGSAVTRSKEGANLTGLSNVFGSSASTTFVEIDIPPSGSLSPTGVWTLTAAADTSNFISMCQFDSGITTPRVALYIGGVAIIDQYLSTPLSEGAHKVCFVYQDGSQKLFIDGVEELSLTESFNYVEFTKLSINDAAWALGNNGGPYSNKQTLVFPTALTDSECIALTTI
jgi:hypothetical protein